MSRLHLLLVCQRSYGQRKWPCEPCLSSKPLLASTKQHAALSTVSLVMQGSHQEHGNPVACASQPHRTNRSETN